jgi:hypothetical protein
MIPKHYIVAGFGILAAIGLATTIYWVQANQSCTVQQRTTVPATGETVVTNRTVSGGYAPAICSMETPEDMVLGLAGPLLFTAGIWFGFKTAI